MFVRGVTSANESVLNRLNAEEARRFMPVVAILATLMAIAIIGNLLVSYIYCFKVKRSSANCFIAWLAVLDIVSCSLGIPFEILDLLRPYTFHLRYVCKIMRFSSSATVIASGVTLVAVAFDRYRKIAKPLRRFRTRTAKILNLCSLEIGLVMAVPAWFVFGRRRIALRVNGTVVIGYECSIDESMDDTRFPVMYYSSLAVVFVLCVLSLVALYGRLAHKILVRKHRIIGECLGQCERYARIASVDSDAGISSTRGRFLFTETRRGVTPNAVYDDIVSGYDGDVMDKSADRNGVTVASRAQYDGVSENVGGASCGVGAKTESKLKSTDRNGSLLAYRTSHTDADINVGDLTIPTSDEVGTVNKPKPAALVLHHQTSRTGSVSIRTGRVTGIFICVSVVFVLSFLPYVVAKLTSRFVPRAASTVGYNLAARSFFLNAAANPLLYSFLNEHFRSECAALFHRSSRRRR